MSLLTIFSCITMFNLMIVPWAQHTCKHIMMFSQEIGLEMCDWAANQFNVISQFAYLNTRLLELDTFKLYKECKRLSLENVNHTNYMQAYSCQVHWQKGLFFREVGLNNKDKDKHTTHREELGKWERNGTVKGKLIASSTGQLRFINILIIYRLIPFFFYIVVHCN